MSKTATQLSDEIIDYGLQHYALELETDGLTIVPPDITGITEEVIDLCNTTLLTSFTQMTGCPISLERGPEAELIWPDNAKKASLLTPDEAPQPTQMLVQQLLQIGRCFRDLAVNPVVDALIKNMTGEFSYPGLPSMRNRRL